VVTLDDAPANENPTDSDIPSVNDACRVVLAENDLLMLIVFERELIPVSLYTQLLPV
jgi:hypothetical protein